MNEVQKKAYASRYFRTGAEVRLPKDDRLCSRSKYDAIRLLSTPDFGNLNTATTWQFIGAPFVLNPTLKKSDRDRYVTFMGGDMRNLLQLGGDIEIAVGRRAEELCVYRFERSVTVFIPAGMYYVVVVKTLTDDKCPILYNELTFSPSVRPAYMESAADFSDLFRSGKDLWFQKPIHPAAMYPRVEFNSCDFSGTQTLRRRWTPVSHAYETAAGIHTHAYDTFLCFTGSDPENMLDLGGEIELTIGEPGRELITFSSSVACQFFLKKGLLHSLPVFKKVTNPNRPILMTETAFTDGSGGMITLAAPGVPADDYKNSPDSDNQSRKTRKWAI